MLHSEIGPFLPKRLSWAAMKASGRLSQSVIIPAIRPSRLATASASSGSQTRELVGYISDPFLTYLSLAASTVSNAAKVVNKVRVSRDFNFLHSSELLSDCPEAKLSGFTVDGTFQQYVVCQN
jgi:hypothetical protein